MEMPANAGVIGFPGQLLHFLVFDITPSSEPHN
jgi:hypothetical protein